MMQSKQRLRPQLILLAMVAPLLLVGCGEDEAAFEWVLTWEDNFTGSSGELPNAAKWTFDIGTNWGNNQLEFDTDRPINVSLDGNGNLAIVAREESYQGSAYTSGRIKTQGKFQQHRGRFEARIKLPVGQGIWPAFWLLGSNFNQVGWPQCGEIDIMEYLGQQPNVIHGTVHGPGYSGGGGIGQSYTLPGANFNDGFYVFGIEWGENYIHWTIDGRRYHTVTDGAIPGGNAWVFNRPFFIILNVAVGGNWPGPPDATTAFPQTMLVDWVRVYSFTQK